MEGGRWGRVQPVAKAIGILTSIRRRIQNALTLDKQGAADFPQPPSRRALPLQRRPRPQPPGVGMYMA